MIRRRHHHYYRGGEIVGRVRLSRTCLRCGRYQDTGPLHAAGTVPAPASMPDTCPTCGSPVTVVSTDEGTSHYLPADVLALREALKATRNALLGTDTEYHGDAPCHSVADTVALADVALASPLHAGVVSVPVVPLGAPRAGERVR